MADEVMLKRIIYNLISNAISYGTYELHIVISETDKILVEVQNAVEDESMIDVNRLFDRFYMADLSRNHSGTGLGLYIVKLLMEKMGGTVKATCDNKMMCITLSFLVQAIENKANDPEM